MFYFGVPGSSLSVASLLIHLCNAHEGCTPRFGDKLSAVGDALIQTKRFQKSSPLILSLEEINGPHRAVLIRREECDVKAHHCLPVLPAGLEKMVQLHTEVQVDIGSGHVSKTADGASATLDASGFKETTSLCCPVEMEIFFIRLLDFLSYRVCSTPHLQGLMHWFTCVPDMDFQYVLDTIINGNPCKYWALQVETCPVLSAACAGQWCGGSVSDADSIASDAVTTIAEAAAPVTTTPAAVTTTTETTTPAPVIDCTVPVASHHGAGCASATWSSGNPSQQWCEGTPPHGIDPWYPTCCNWDASETLCKDKVKTLVNCENGETAYQAIERGLARSRRRRASKPYEVPDTCPNFDSSTGHRIQCCSMPPGLPSGPTPTGKIFKFELHLEDCEPVSQAAGKQRNEIKVWGNSPSSLKGYFGTTMRYTWSFFIDSAMTLSRKYTHIMQIKGSGGDGQMPFVTFTGNKDTKGDMKFQVRWSPYSSSNPELLRSGLPHTTIRETEWLRFAGHWVTASVEITMKKIDEGGRLKVDLNYANGTSILQMDQAAGLWRAANEKFESNDYLRPKWGIYRQVTHSMITPGDLNNATVYFANFAIESLA